MNSRILNIIVMITTFNYMLHAVVKIQSPVALTIPLRTKVYGINKDKPFMIQEYEKPKFFRSFDNDTIVNKYSWKYISRARKDELGYILLGYEEPDKDDLKKAGASLWDTTKNQLAEPAPTVASAKEGPPPAASASLESGTPTAAPQDAAQAAASAAQPKEGENTSTTPGQPIEIAASTTQNTTPETDKKGKIETKTPAKEAKKKAKPAPITRPQVPGDEKTLLLELNIVCTNMPGITLTDDQIEAILPGGKVYAAPVDLIKHKNCYFVAKKYKNDAPEAEVKEWTEKIYGAILGPGGSLDIQ